MKIRNIDKGRDYQLTPGTTLQIERTNPFFNEYGEQSLPVDLPDTPVNRELTGHPEDLANSARPNSGVQVEIIDGEYHVRAEQHVLSARRNEKISTSYLLAQSQLYAIIGDTQLIDVFGDTIVQGTSAMDLDEKIAWLDDLKNHNHPNFDVFPVAMDKADGGGLGYTLLNARGVLFTWLSDSGKQYFWPAPRTDAGTEQVSSVLWLNAADRTRGPKIMNDSNLNLQQGYYMTPFVRVIHILRRMLTYFGYTLVYQSDAVIDKMVFINNTIDSMVTGNGILYSDLLPDCSCSDLLDLFRHKFNMEFILDETTDTVTMVSFADVICSTPVDLSLYSTGHPEIEYTESYRRLVLSPAGAREGEVAPPLRETLAKHSLPVWDALYGGWTVEGHQGYNLITELVADGNTGYNIGGETELEEEELKSPDIIPTMVSLIYDDVDSGHSTVERLWTFPYIGAERALHSRLADAIEDTTELQARPGLDMMVILPYNDYMDFPRGTLTNWDYFKFFKSGTRTKINSSQDYSLCYHGNDGLFDRYWRGRDDLLRNAMNRVRTRLLLPDSLKMTLSPLNRVLINGVSMLIDTLGFTLGQDDAIQESVMLTTSLQAPVGHATESEDIVPEPQGCHWVLRCTYRLSDETAYSLVEAFRPQTEHLLYPPKVFPILRASTSNLGQECCLQYQLVKLSPGDYVPFRYGVDTVNWYYNDEPDLLIMPSYIGNQSQHNKYLSIESKLVCETVQS